MTTRLATALLPLLTLLAACQTSGGPSLIEIAPTVNATLNPGEVVLGPGDQLQLRFPYSPTWDQEIVVAPDGSASFLSLGQLVVAGITLDALNTNLRDAYAHVLENSDVNVILMSVGARSIYVMGEVDDPGQYEIGPDQHMTLVEALAMAGGPLKESAYLAHTLLLRWDASDREQLSWKIDADPEYWTGSEPLYLQPYDVIYVPNTPIDSVGIWIDNYIRRLIPFPYLAAPAR
ncbi:MAG: polysaccharide biosynthesis/export family protein [Planctomycetota bacterium]|jgi:protein involved in polysaccharide export with SLBB domain